MITDNNNYLLARANVLLSKIELSPVIIPLPDKSNDIRVFYHSAGKTITVYESSGIIRRIKTPQTVGVTDTLGMRVAYVVNSSEDNPAELVLIRSGQHLADNLRYLLLLLIAGSLISVLLAGLISYLVAYYLLLPVQRIIHAARLINTNKLRDVIPVKNTNDELQELTETINSMLVRIDESLQQQQNFFASASHELKTPLAIMRAEIEVELGKAKAEDGVAELLKSQLNEINRLQQVVQEFLLISQIKSGGISLYKESVDVSSLIVKVFNKLYPLLHPKKLKTNIVFNQEIESFVVSADFDKLFIMFLNVIENSIKYSPEGEEISCYVQETSKKDLMQISIINVIQENRVATENLQIAFHRENFRQNGAGLGLWLSKKIVELHQGSIEIESKDYQFIVNICLLKT